MVVYKSWMRIIFQVLWLRVFPWIVLTCSQNHTGGGYQDALPFWATLCHGYHWKDQ